LIYRLPRSFGVRCSILQGQCFYFGLAGYSMIPNQSSRRGTAPYFINERIGQPYRMALPLKSK
ncbi:MAG: hypothetical protein KH334_08890, partial [Clostridiales bacterium]|nr:hypothetical protein [Clostridiales bacterium]